MSLGKSTTIALIIIIIFLSGPKSIVRAITPTPTFPGPRAEGSVVTVKIDAIVGSLRLVGFTSPNSIVTFLLDGSIVGTQLSCPGGVPSICSDSSTNGYFDKTITGLGPGTYNVGVYAIDTSSPALTTPTINRLIPIIQGVAQNADPLTLPPTLKVDKLVMKRPERQIARGLARPNAAIRIFYNNINPLPQDTPIDNSGNFATTGNSVLPLGNNFATAIVQGLGGAISQSSQIVTFKVEMSADLNIDTQVDILDFSSLMFDYGSATPNDWATDINDDTSIDLVDFSIMMFNWTGA
jgi:hypothetical protein